MTDSVAVRQTSEHHVLLVAGLARSGTTALQRVLDPHPDIALGLERYKRLWGARIGELDAGHFERERFFDFSDGLTNITPDVDWAAPRIELLDGKWDAARYRGDKMTVIRAQRLWQTIPDARFVLIVRDLAEVAHSWERRSADAADTGWNREAGAERAIEAWNASIRRVLRAVRRRPGHACVVEYSGFFGDPGATALRRVMDFLGLDPAPVLPAFAEAHQQYVGSVAGRDRTLPPELASLVAEGADRRAWRDVVALA